MTDIVDRLRRAGLKDGFAIILKQHVDEAAAEIERLTTYAAGWRSAAEDLGAKCQRREAEVERLTRERDEWKKKWIALAQAALKVAGQWPRSPDSS